MSALNKSTPPYPRHSQSGRARASGPIHSGSGGIVSFPVRSTHPMLKKWEREGEQIKSGTLDRKALDAAQQSGVPLETHLANYEQGLIAAAVSDGYRANVLRAVRRGAADCGFSTPADLEREPANRFGWFRD